MPAPREKAVRLSLYQGDQAPSAPDASAGPLPAPGPDRDPDDLLQVGELAKATGKTVRAIHLYEELGLLRAHDRSKGRYRLFTSDAVVRVRWITKLQGMSLLQKGTIDLAYIAVIEGPVEQADLEGVYDSVKGDFQIDSAGALNGTGDGGCLYSGQVKVIDPDWNVYRMTLTISQCLGYEGEYSGLATLDIYDEADMLWVMISNPQLSVFDGWLFSPAP